MNKKEQDHKALQYCIQLVEDKLAEKKMKLWTHNDFIKLSEEIFASTKHKISETTLKRIWGKAKYQNYPNTGTLDALASYVGYKNWYNFLDSEKEAIGNREKPKKSTSGKLFSLSWNSIKKKQIYSIVIFLLLLTTLILVFTHPNKSEKDLTKAIDQIEFHLDKTADFVPYSSYLHYNLASLEGRDIKIRVGGEWGSDTKDYNITERLSDKFLTNQKKPGKKFISLVVDDKVIKSVAMWGKTKGWLGIIHGETEKDQTIFLPEDSIVFDGKMQLNQDLITERTDVADRKFRFFLVSDFDISLDNLFFETKFKLSQTDEANICDPLFITLTGENAYISIPFHQTVCLLNSVLFLSEKRMSARFLSNSLSDFTLDYNNWNSLQVHVQSKHVKFYLNETLIFQDSYNNPCGKLRIIDFAFNDFLIIDDLKVMTPEGKILLNSSFEE